MAHAPCTSTMHHAPACAKDTILAQVWTFGAACCLGRPALWQYQMSIGETAGRRADRCGEETHVRTAGVLSFPWAFLLRRPSGWAPRYRRRACPTSPSSSSPRWCVLPCCPFGAPYDYHHRSGQQKPNHNLTANLKIHVGYFVDGCRRRHFAWSYHRTSLPGALPVIPPQGRDGTPGRPARRRGGAQ